MAGTAEKYVARYRDSAARKVSGANRGRIVTCPPAIIGARQLTRMAFTWNSGRTSRQLSSGPSLVASPIEAAIAVKVRVVEHHALRAAGRAAGVNQQREIVRAGVRRGQHAARTGVQLARCQDRHPVPGAWIGGEQQLGCRVGDLVAGLVGREHRIDRSRRGAQPPRGHQPEQQLHLVGQHHGDHVAPAHPGRGELLRDRVYPAGHLGVGQLGVRVAHADTVARRRQRHGK